MVTVKQKFHYLADGSIDIESWLNQVGRLEYLRDINLIQRAIQLAEEGSKGLTTFYGQPCIEQGLEMAEILLEMKLDQAAIAAAIIASTVKHTSISIEVIEKELGDVVATLLKSIIQMSALNHLQKTRDKTQIDRLGKLFFAMVSDIRAVLIKLAEQTCIMRGINKINPIERKRLAEETMNIYAPLANRLGIGQLKWELEDIAFHYTNPEDYKKIANFLSERRIDREQRIHETIALLDEHLAKANIHAKITGRAKHIYSIYLKMRRKHVDYKNIYDYSAIRILVPELNDCYTVLGTVHHLFEHIPEEFDDYITKPKPNGYRSIHTAVIGLDGKNLEIQIRTTDMHDEAEHGVAAHWIYKESNTQQSGYEAKVTYLRQLLAWHKDIARDDATENKTMQMVLDDSVYVFTPENEIIDLPLGSTPLDFAYHIHSELGHRCRGAKIQGHIVPLTYQLRTGDQIEIITTPNGTPSRDWLNKDSGYLKTSRARSKVLHWFKQQDVAQYVELGKHNLERELVRAGIHHPNFEKIASNLNYKNEQALFAAIGHGNIRIAHVLHTLKAEHTSESVSKTVPVAPAKQPSESQGGLEIAGIHDLLTRIARCCKPIPGDRVIGYITQGRGVSIHREDCNNLVFSRKHHDHRLIPVAWDSNKMGAYYVDLQIRASGQHDILKEITAMLANSKIELVSLNSTVSKRNNIIYIVMTLQIHDLDQLKHITNQISQLPRVIDVKRMSE